MPRKTPRYEIVWSPLALGQMKELSKARRVMIFNAIDTQLVLEPLATTNLKKEITHGDRTVRQLRVSDYRVWYDVEERRVLVQLVFFKGPLTTAAALAKAGIEDDF